MVSPKYSNNTCQTDILQKCIVLYNNESVKQSTWKSPQQMSRSIFVFCFFSRCCMVAYILSRSP